MPTTYTTRHARDLYTASGPPRHRGSSAATRTRGASALRTASASGRREALEVARPNTSSSGKHAARYAAAGSAATVPPCPGPPAPDRPAQSPILGRLGARAPASSAMRRFRDMLVASQAGDASLRAPTAGPESPAPSAPQAETARRTPSPPMESPPAAEPAAVTGRASGRARAASWGSRPQEAPATPERPGPGPGRPAGPSVGSPPLDHAANPAAANPQIPSAPRERPSPGERPRQARTPSKITWDPTPEAECVLEPRRTGEFADHWPQVPQGQGLYRCRRCREPQFPLFGKARRGAPWACFSRRFGPAGVLEVAVPDLAALSAFDVDSCPVRLRCARCGAFVGEVAPESLRLGAAPVAEERVVRAASAAIVFDGGTIPPEYLQVVAAITDPDEDADEPAGERHVAGALFC